VWGVGRSSAQIATTGCTASISERSEPDSRLPDPILFVVIVQSLFGVVFKLYSRLQEVYNNMTPHKWEQGWGWVVRVTSSQVRSGMPSRRNPGRQVPLNAKRPLFQGRHSLHS